MTVAVEAILFDVDETLFDRRAAQGLVIERLPGALPWLFGGFDAARLAAAWERSDRDTENHVHTDGAGGTRAARDRRSALFLGHLGLDAVHAGAVTDFYLATYPEIAAPVDGAAELVARCAARWPVGVVSNAFPDVQYRKLERLNLRRHFRCIVLSEEYGGPRKPAPEIFRHGCRALGATPGATLYVGDSFAHDVVGARGAGLIPCWYNPAGAPPPPGQKAPDLQVASLRELPDLLA